MGNGNGLSGAAEKGKKVFYNELEKQRKKMSIEIKFRALYRGNMDLLETPVPVWHYGVPICGDNPTVVHLITKEYEIVCDAETVGQFSGFQDKHGAEIYAGDIIGLKNGSGRDVLAICKFGSSIRALNGVDVEIIGFYFQVGDFHSFPIVNNYAGVHDTEIFEVIGNIYQTPELLT